MIKLSCWFTFVHSFRSSLWIQRYIAQAIRAVLGQDLSCRQSGWQQQPTGDPHRRWSNKHESCLFQLDLATQKYFTTHSQKKTLALGPKPAKVKLNKTSEWWTWIRVGSRSSSRGLKGDIFDHLDNLWRLKTAHRSNCWKLMSVHSQSKHFSNLEGPSLASTSDGLKW